MSDRPELVRSLISKVLDKSKHSVEAARIRIRGGQVVGMGWLAVRIDGGRWIDVNDRFRDELRLWQEVSACDTLEEVRAFVLGEE